MQESCKNLAYKTCTQYVPFLAQSCTNSCKISQKMCKKMHAGNYSCSNSCKILHHFLQDMCKIVQESCKKRNISRASLACMILAQSCMILQVRFCWACSNCLQPHSVVEVYTEVERHHQQFCRTHAVIQCDKEVECPIVDGHLPSPVHYSYPLLRYGDLIL